MGLIKGQTDYQRWKRGEELTRKEAIEAQCYSCNGGENEFCGGTKSCPLYKFSPFSHEAIRKRAVSVGKGHSGEISGCQNSSKDEMAELV